MRLFILLSIVLLICSQLIQAQLPQLTTSDKTSPLILKVLEVDVKIIGNRSSTTFTMTFHNPFEKVLEGTFVLPLPEGAAVIRYSLDINGKMREGVPVEREKATEIFESIEKRRIDPGLLEKTEGNVFRTRIFPIPAGGQRSIIIAFEQDLLLNNSNELTYHLPLESKEPIHKFSITVNVKQKNSTPVLDSMPVAGLKFSPINHSCCAQVAKEDVRLNGSLTIRIPKKASDVETYIQKRNGEQYFYLHTFLPESIRDKVLPKKIALIWDVSLSGLYRNTAKEMALLSAYLKRCNNVSVELYTLNNSFQSVGVFEVLGGDAKDLLNKLKEITYDGGTDYSKINFSKVGETLLFSDGLSTLSDYKPLSASHLVYIVSSSVKANYSVLKSIAETNGGAFINLVDQNEPEALKSLTIQTLRYLGIKANESITAHYPSTSTAVENGFTLSGIVEGEDTNLILQFGYGNKVLFEKEVRLHYNEFEAAEWNLSRIFAQRKIEELDRAYEQNKEEILRLGKLHSLVTRNTSLLVLEEVADYVQHEIEPPAELREEYKRLRKERRNEVTDRKTSTLENAIDYADALWKWWNTSFPVKKEAFTKKFTRGTINDSVVTISHEGRVSAPPVLLHEEVQLNNISVAKDEEITVRNSLTGSVAGVQLQDVVVIGYNTKMKGAATVLAPGNNSQLLIVDGIIASGLPPQSEIDRIEVMEAKAGVALYGSKAMNGVMLVTTKKGSEKSEPEINIVEQASKADYMRILATAPKEQQYQTYLELRDKNLLNPTFYYDMANFFLKTDRALNLQILTNLGELDYQNHELHKLFGFKLKDLGEGELEQYVFRKILIWRPQEPQSYRDYALALMNNGKYQQALDTLYLALVKEYNSNVMENYEGIEETIVTEINNLMLHAPNELNSSAINKKLLHKMPVDIRVVLNWNMNDTDIDLWVTDPDGEKCFYSHSETKAGGRMSEDFTEGYGPEQFLLKKAKKGKYKIEVHHYGSNSVKIAGKTTLLVEVFTNYGRSNQQRKLITLQLDEEEEKEGIFVGEFIF